MAEDEATVALPGGLRAAVQARDHEGPCDALVDWTDSSAGQSQTETTSGS